MEAVGREGRIPAHDGKIGRCERHTQDDHDRRDPGLRRGRLYLKAHHTASSLRVKRGS